jgi:hypothetical protein
VNVRKALIELIRIVADEAEANSDFRQRLEVALNLVPKTETQTNGRPKRAASLVANQRPKNRRPPPVVDPVEVARLGEPALRVALAKLSLDQLRDVVAEYGMDPGKLVLKWKAADRVIDRIVEISMGRAQKGDAFRSDANQLSKHE